MSKIRVLSEHLSNRIAAGEVIERPASVVKELVENAIDAGATQITVHVERAGSRLISVTDNGSGMDADDALLCLEPHGTSKIRDEEDIHRIETLGFRGEAIPSIAAISKFSIRSRTAEMQEGILVTVHGGTIQDAIPAGCPVGTRIEVRDLFYNTPARKKFLKSQQTEEHHIEEALLLLALPYPQIAFELYFDGKRAISSPAAQTLEPRLRAFFGKNFAEQMLPASGNSATAEVTGFTAAPGFTRTSRKEQRTFVNGRAVESPAIYRGIRNGYATLDGHGRFPPCVLFLTVDPEMVDVNVHPAKREVRFKADNDVAHAVANAVQSALQCRPIPQSAPQSALDYQVPVESFLESVRIQYTPQPQETELDFTPAAPAETREEPPKMKHQHLAAAADLPDFSAPPAFRQMQQPKAEQPDLSDLPLPQEDEMEIPSPMPNAMIFDGSWPTSVIGVLDRTYILAESPAGLVLIDQHAAHERILFEKLLRDAASSVPSQQLLIPAAVELPRPAAAMLWRCREFLKQLGFDLEPLGNTTVMLNALPAALPAGELDRMLLDLLDELVENSSAHLPLEREMVARAACKAAIKAHDTLTLEMAKNLLEQLGRCRQGTLCPHGRPTMLTITVSEIERRFGRK